MNRLNPPEASRPKRWRVRPEPSQVPEGPFPALIGRLLAHRGVRSGAEARAFLEGEAASALDPYRLPQMERAVARLASACRGGETVAVFGDFDVDGLAATALLAEGLKGLGARAIAYVPDRFKEGYGLNMPAIEGLGRQGATVLVAADCGTSSLGEVAFACERGMDVIIVDHHTVPPGLPTAQALVNPKLSRGGGPGEELASAGLAYHLLAALHDALGQSFAEEGWLDLVALGTVCDVAPLVRGNRELVRGGLAALARTRRPGLRALMEVARVEPARVDTEVLSFALGPRLNAAGRIAHPRLSYELLTCEAEEEARALALRLDELNQERQRLTREALELAGQLVEEEAEGTDAPLLMLGHAEISSGIVGLVASRLAERYYRPVVVYERGEMESRASARSIPGFDIVGALRECRELFLRYGGHPQAAGFTAENERLPAIKQRLLAHARRELAEVELGPSLDIDEELRLRSLRGEEIGWLGRLRPHGMGNPEPTFVSRGVLVEGSWLVGGEGEHLRLKLRDGPVMWPAIGFRLGQVAPAEGDLLDVVFSFSPDRRGSGSLELQVKDLSPARAMG